MRAFLCLAALMAAAPASAADIVHLHPFIYISGTIEFGDDLKFADVSKGVRVAIVSVDSSGGDVGAAMGIGRIIRKSGMAVSVADGKRCASSCIFVLASGLTKIVGDADVIIHRPYLAEELPNGAYDRQFKQMRASIESYLAEMNIPPQLADRMIAIPPQRSEVLTRSELEKYMLNGDDPAYAQMQAAKEAKNLGISLAEQNRRKGLSESICAWNFAETRLFEFMAYSFCKDAVMGGIPPSVVKDRVHSAVSKRAVMLELDDDAQVNCLRRFIMADGTSCPLR